MCLKYLSQQCAHHIDKSIFVVFLTGRYTNMHVHKKYLHTTYTSISLSRYLLCKYFSWSFQGQWIYPCNLLIFYRLLLLLKTQEASSLDMFFMLPIFAFWFHPTGSPLFKTQDNEDYQHVQAKLSNKTKKGDHLLGVTLQRSIFRYFL